jgi:drug/metabolite transporter (DMT)-like permease
MMGSIESAKAVPVGIPRPLVRANQWFIVVCVLAAWVTHVYWILVLPLVAGLGGALFNYNPVMRFARLFLRKPAAEYPLEDRDQQRVNQWIAVGCLLLSLVSFAAGWTITGYVFSAMVFLAAFVAILGFCIGCFLQYQIRMALHRRRMRHT